MEYKEKIGKFLDSKLDINGTGKNLKKIDINKKKQNNADYSLHLMKFGDMNNIKEKIKNTEQEELNKNNINKLEIINDILYVSINKNYLMYEILKKILNEGCNYGKKNLNKKVIIEYSSPNIAKPFHAGHLRSTILGQFLTNLNKFVGNNVLTINYLGDWGKQFGIIGIGLEILNINLNDLYQLGEEKSLNKIADVYVEMNNRIKNEKLDGMKSKTDELAKQFFADMEKTAKLGETSDRYELWKYIREISIKKYIKIYKELGITFDVYSGESEYFGDNIPEELNQHIVQENEIKLVNLENIGMGKFILVKDDGSSLYSLRDIHACLDRNIKYNFDEMLYVVASEQEYYFKRLIATINLINPELSMKCKHISFGLVEGMSSREGNVILLEDILNKSNNTMMSKIQNNELTAKRVQNISETAKILGKSCIFIQDFKADRKKNYKFEWKRATDFHGKTGPYLQYAHVRLYNIIEKALKKGIHIIQKEEIDNIDFEKLLPESVAHEIIFLLSDFNLTIEKCLSQYDPSTLINWLFDFINCVFRAYDSLPVTKCEDLEQASARLLLFTCSKLIIETSLKLLCLDPLEKM